MSTSRLRVTSRDYLARAQARMSDSGSAPEALIYAALELRCGIEARLHEYLDARQKLPRRRHGWQVSKLGALMDRTCKDGDRYAEVTIYHPERRKRVITVGYTRVTPWLKKAVGQLGDLLHAQDPKKVQTELWENRTLLLLERVAHELLKANLGTLLGPPMQDANGNMALLVQGLVPMSRRVHRITIDKKRIPEIVHVSYHDNLRVLSSEEAAAAERHGVVRYALLGGTEGVTWNGKGDLP